MTFIPLKLAILERFNSQADFAAKIGEHESTVSRVVRGRRKLSPEEAKVWKKTLQCGVDLLQGVVRPESSREGAQ